MYIALGLCSLNGHPFGGPLSIKIIVSFGWNPLNSRYLLCLHKLVRALNLNLIFRSANMLPQQKKSGKSNANFGQHHITPGLSKFPFTILLFICLFFIYIICNVIAPFGQKKQTFGSI